MADLEGLPPADPSKTAPGQRQYQALLDSGKFSKADADAWKERTTATLQAAKFSEQKISAYWGDGEPSSHPDAPTRIPGGVGPPGAPHVASNVFEAWDAGWDMSDTGLVAHLNARNVGLMLGHGDKPLANTVLPENAGLGMKIASGAAGMVGDLPWMFAGMAAGPEAGGVTGKFALGGGLPEASRNLLINAYNFHNPNSPNNIATWGDFAMANAKDIWKDTQAAATSGLGGKIGGLAAEGATAMGAPKLIASAADVAGFTTASTGMTAAMAGKVPDASDFAASAIAALGFAGIAHVTAHGAPVLLPSGQRVVANLQQIYTRTGIPPSQIMHIALNHPEVMAEVLAHDPQGEAVTPLITQNAPPPVPTYRSSLKTSTSAAAVTSHLPETQIATKPEFVTPTEPTPPPVPNVAPKTARAALMGGTAHAAVGGQLPKIAQPEMAPTVDHAITVLVGLEGSGDSAVSKPAFAGSRGGAIGRFQIMPSTARLYWRQVFGTEAPGAADIGKALFDPAVNKRIGTAIITHLFNRFHGDMTAMSIAYNSGEGRAAQWLTKGPGVRLEAIPDKTVRGGRRYEYVPAAKDEGFLPLETQHYLADLRRRFGPQGAGGAAEVEGNLGPGHDPSAKPGDAFPSEVFAEENKPAEEEPPEGEKPGTIGGSLSAASTWEHATAEEIINEMNSNIGIAPDPRRNISLDSTIHALVSELTPARRVDDALIHADLLDRNKEMGLEGHLRQTYASDNRAAAFATIGPVDAKTRMITGTTNLAAAAKDFHGKGGTLDGFRAALNAKRTVGRDPAGSELAARLQAVKDLEEQAKIKRMSARDLRKNADKVAAKTKMNIVSAAKWEKDPHNLAAIKAEKDAEAADNALRNAKQKSQGIETGFNQFAAAAMVDRPEIFAPYKDAVDQWNEVMDGVRRYVRDSGIHSEAQYQAIKDSDTVYVSWRRLIGDDRPFGGGHDVGRGPSDPFKRMEGSDRQIADPIAATIDNMRIAVANADRNMARLWLIDKAAANPDFAATLGLKIEKSADPNDDEIDRALKQYGFKDGPELEKAREAYGNLIAQRQEAMLGDNEFQYFRDGKVFKARVDNPVLAKLFRNATDKVDTGVIGDVFQWFAKMDRTGIAGMPDYAPNIAIFHQLNQFIFDPAHPIPWTNPIKGIMHVLKKDDVFNEVLAQGGFGAALVNMDRDSITARMDHVMEDTGAAGRVWNTVKNPRSWPNEIIQGLQLVNETLDAANRVGYYKTLTGKGIDPTVAATRARKAGLDYHEMAGAAVINKISSWAPFFRAHLLGEKQGWESLSANNFSETGATGKIKKAATLVGLSMAAVTLPKIALYILNREQDKDLPENERYSSLPRWERDRYYVLPQIGGVRLKFRMPANVGFAFGTVPERFMDAMHDHLGPEAFKHMWSDFINEYVPLPSIPALSAPLEVAMNHSFYTGQPLIPDSMKGLTPDMQVTPSTTAPAKALAQVMDPIGDFVTLGASHGPAPIQIEHLVQGWTGPAGMEIFRALDAVDAARTNRPEKPHDLADNLFVRGFVIRHPGMNTQPVEDFYERFQQFSEQKGDMELKSKQAGLEGEEQPDLSGVDLNMAGSTDSVGQIAQAISTQRALIFAITNNKEMSVDEKRQGIENIYTQATVEAMLGNELMKIMSDKKLDDDQKQEAVSKLSDTFGDRLEKLRDQATPIPGVTD